MKRFLLLLLVFSGFFAEGQVYNNEWIDYSKSYYKFKVRPDTESKGLHRINQPLLAANGLGTIPAEQFQLWRDGKQVPIYTSVQTGVMGGSDYIEFWGQINDGKTDKALYKQPDFQLSDHYSLETDTAYYFLTVNTNTAANLRLVPTTNNVAGNTLPANPYLMYTAGGYFRAKINSGYAAVVTEYVYSSAYDQGEGWSSNDIDSGLVLTTTLTGLHPYMGPGAPESNFTLNAVGNALQARKFLVKINGVTVANPVMDYFDYVKINVPFDRSAISSGAANIDIMDQAAASPDRMVVSQYEMTYPRLFDFDNARNFNFNLPANPAGDFLQITNFNYNFTTPVLYDLTNGRRYSADLTNPAILKFALLPSNVNRSLVLVAEDGANIMTISNLQKRDFINYSLSQNQGDFLIITHPSLTSGTTNPVEDYRAYRSSGSGGSYNAKIYMIDQLTDQFAFGIKLHPHAIQSFLRWARVNFSSPLKSVFLVGRGMVYNQYRALEGQPRVDELALVPTFGYPASDNLLGTEPGNEIPATPVGRLAVINSDEVAVYLAKVKEYEQAQAFSSPLIIDKAWMKNIMHVVGASDPVLQAILDTYMDHYSVMISDTLFGGNVNRFSKSSTDAVQQLSNLRVANLFRDGMGILTYFGHSSATTLEFNLDDPQVYENPGKYPVFIALGCNAGNFYSYTLTRFQQKTTISESFVLAPHRGAIAFIASTHFGIVHYLDIMNTRMYNAIGNTQYGKTLGEAQIEMMNEVFNLTTQNDYYARFHCEQATIHGDPMLKFNTSTKPDYVIEPQLLKINPSFVSVADTIFHVNIKFMNIGKAISDSIVIETRRSFPDPSTPQVVRLDTVRGTRYIDSLNFDLKIVPTRDKGLNKLTVTLDAGNKVDELYETNNTVTKDFFIYEDEARPVYPYNLAIVNQQNIKLKASTADPFSSQKQYAMELDTTELFNSPFKITRTTTTIGGVMEFTPGITFTDSTTYYWRVAPVPATGQPVWNKSSFVYLPASDYGFNQSHLYQHFKSDLLRMRLDSTSRLWSYKDKTTNLFVRNGVFSEACSQASCLSVAVNGDPYIRSVCGQGGIIFHVFDPVTMKPWINNQGPVFPAPGFFGSDPVCGATRIYNFQYALLDTNKRRKIVELLDLIPDGYYVVVRNISSSVVASNSYASDWANDTTFLGSGNSMYHRLKAQGFTNIDSFYKPRAFAFVYKKNGSNKFTPKSAFTDGIFDNLALSADCPSPDTLGFMTSPAYGPAKTWKRVKWNGTADGPDDHATLDVVGVKNDGTETTLFNGLTTGQQDFDISSIDALIYPNIKLKLRTLDSIKFTPYQMRYWRVTYVPVPEGAIAPNLYYRTKDTVEVGEPVDFEVAFKNISDAPFDSLKVKLVVTDKTNMTHIIPILRRRPIPANSPGNDTVHLATIIPTDNLSGHNTVYIEANSDNDQPEQYHFNNFAYRSLYVRPDSLSPLLDVTFDGVHILNRDIVASKPQIIIKLKDEAKWLVLDDTSLVNLQVKYPNGSIHRYYFGANDTLKFNPAGQAPNTDNTASITFTPYFPVDGEYELAVSGRDKSNNEAGNISYRITFQVINKPMISNMLNYPNPFTTSTAFVFTITGSEVPQNIKIEIMTITGKIVREITKNELGPLHVGRNITEFKWDGTDQYGQKLGNGIYLYRVVTNLNGKSLDKYRSESDNTDKYFNKGYGKMVLIR